MQKSIVVIRSVRPFVLDDYTKKQTWYTAHLQVDNKYCDEFY